MRDLPFQHAIIVCIAVIAVSCLGQTPQPFQVFFVAVGSGWYANPAVKGVEGFGRIPGANKSAKIVADSLVAGGAVYGVELTSDDGSFVTVADMLKAVRQVSARLTLTKPARPLFIFYFAGHGISEGIAWSHFSVPGDFAYRGDPGSLDIEVLSRSTLYAGDLVDELEKLHVPFLVLLDTCYDGKERKIDSPLLSSMAIRNLRDVGGVLRAVNEFRDTYPVLYSTMPGNSVATVDNPLEPGSDLEIAPLARRFVLSVRPSISEGRPVTLGAFLGNMTSAGLDRLTTPAVTHSPIPAGADAPFLVPGAPTHAFETSIGTGTRAAICCRRAAAAVPASAAKPNFYTGKLTITGDRGEFISTGSTLTFFDPSAKVTLTQDGPGNLSFRFEKGETEFDASFSTPSGGQFEVKQYPSAQRWTMADAGHPGLEISGDGRGCGDIAGSFIVSEVAYDADGRLSKFSATFSQLCDGAKVSARGSIEVSKIR
jgi:hypothetical protein